MTALFAGIVHVIGGGSCAGQALVAATAGSRLSQRDARSFLSRLSSAAAFSTPKCASTRRPLAS